MAQNITLSKSIFSVINANTSLNEVKYNGVTVWKTDDVFDPANYGNPLTFISNADGSSVKIYSYGGLYFKVNRYTADELLTSVSIVDRDGLTVSSLGRGEKIEVLCTSDSRNPKVKFSIEGNVSVCGNILSLLTTDMDNYVVPSENVYLEYLFSGEGLTDADGLIIPNVSHTNTSLHSLCAECVNMVKPPHILCNEGEMSLYCAFYKCHKLKKWVPLHVSYENLAVDFSYMYSDCLGFEEVYIPIIWTDGYNAQRMFKGCSNLKIIHLEELEHAGGSDFADAFEGVASNGTLYYNKNYPDIVEDYDPLNMKIPYQWTKIPV